MPRHKENAAAVVQQASVVQSIVEARKGSGMTQQQLSKLTGIAQADISKIERGETNPSLQTVCRIASVLGLRLVAAKGA